MTNEKKDATKKSLTLLEEAAQLEARAKQLRREESRFKKMADERKEELLNRWGVTPCSEEVVRHENALKNICQIYGCTVDEFWEYVNTERQVNFYRDNHPRKH